MSPLFPPTSIHQYPEEGMYSSSTPFSPWSRVTFPCPRNRRSSSVKVYAQAGFVKGTGFPLSAAMKRMVFPMEWSFGVSGASGSPNSAAHSEPVRNSAPA